MKRIIIITILFARIVTLSANPMPMSPNAASLAMYADYPVSHYTGIPNINIPLYEIEVDGFKLPISLSYHSNGIKVAQEASWVGLGWTLNAGGAISRTIKGGDDFAGTIYFHSSTGIHTGWYTDADPLSFQSIVDVCGGVKNVLPNAKYTTFCGVNGTRQVIDTEPDIFFYNLPHLSGKFIYNKPRTAVLFDRNHNLKIEWKGIYGFEVTDMNGVKYQFARSERAYMYNGWTENAESFYEAETTWLLSKITTQNGEEIKFSYEPGGFIYGPLHKTYTRSHLLKREANLAPGHSLGYEPPNAGITLPEPSFSRQDTWRLSKIEWKAGYIEFNALTNREDLRREPSGIFPKMLNKMSIYSRDSGLLKSFEFKYSYFNNDYTGSERYLHKRLKLENVTEYDKNNNPLNSGHSFEYFEGEWQAKNSNNKDHWGYNNGSNYDEATAFLAACIGYNSAVVYRKCSHKDAPFFYRFDGTTYYDGVSRESSFDYLKIGTLNKIILPTGETTIFEYEENSFRSIYYASLIPDRDIFGEHKGGGLRIAEIKTGNKVKQFSYGSGKLLIKPVLWYLADLSYSYGHWYEIYLYLVQTSEVTRPLSSLHKGNSIGYSSVRETITDGQESARTWHHFHNEEEDFNQNYSLAAHIDFMNGQVEKVELMENYRPVQTTEYIYTGTASTQIVCSYGLQTPYHHNLWNVLKRDEYTETYDEYGTVMYTSRHYDYNSNLLPKTDSMLINSHYNYRLYPDEKNIWHKTRYRYASDFNDAVSTAMTAKNMIGFPVEVIQMRNNDVVAGQKTEFKQVGNTYLPAVQYQLQTTTPLPQNNYANAYKPVLFYEQYNQQGKILQLRGLDNMPVTYLWSYNGQYPVAEIRNATYDQVKNILTENFINTLAAKTTPTDSDMTAVNNLRTQLPQAMVSTYTYQSLVGMTSATDPRGIRTTYVYDEFQRLKTVLDFQNSKLQEYKYHYQNQ